MKKLRTIVAIMALLCFLVPVHATQVHNITLDAPQERYLESLTRSLKFKAYELCDLCQNGKNMRYKNQSDRDYEYKLNKLKKEIGLIINNIVALYEIIGLDEHQIKAEKADMYKGLCCYNDITETTSNV